MNYLRSWKAFKETWREDRQFQRIGCRLGWYLLFHYRGRLNNRWAKPHPWEHISLVKKKRRFELEVSAPYAGALKGVFLDDEYDCSKLLGAPPETILDLGANIGFGTLYLSAMFPQARLALVEPDPRNLDKLRENLVLNNVSGRIFEAAIGEQEGELRLLFGDDPTCSTLESSGMHKNENAVTVRVVTISQILEKMGWSKIDLLKIDIEGAEEMLLSSRAGWLTKVGAILIEIHPNTSPERIQSYLRPFGFALRRHGQGREPVYIAQRNIA